MYDQNETDLSKYQYEIVWITNKTELETNIDLVEAFFHLYEDDSNFPDPDEREEPRFIKERIEEESNDPHTHLMAFRIIDPQDNSKKFVAGCITEFYPDSACGLVTYIFVNKAYRGLKIGTQQKKIGEILLKSEEGLKGLIVFFEKKYGKKPKAVLFESNNPFLTLEEKDSMPPAKRLKFFKSLGAKRINFDYIQPPLEAGKKSVTNLYLLTFPDLANLEGTIEVKTVLGFVMELAKSLDRNMEEDPKSKYGIENYLNDLKEIETLTPETKLIGLLDDGINIIQTTYENLSKNASNSKKTLVDLTDIPGAA